MEYNFNENAKECPEKKRDNSFWKGLFTGLLLSLLIVSSAFSIHQIYEIYQMKTAKKAVAEESPEVESVVNDQSMSKLDAIEDAISKYYYKEEVDKQQLVDGMYEGVVKALNDPYSTYYTEEDINLMMEQTEGIYYGIGAYVGLDQNTGFPRISGVIEGTPAEAAGLRDGDIIYKVDEEDMQGYELSEVVARIKGLEGTKVHLTLYREGEKDYLELDIERKQIESPTVKSEILDNGIGYLQIVEFDEITVKQFKEAMTELRGQGMKGLIIDLRGNPGGTLNAVTQIAQEMLPKGLIVYTEDREGNRTQYSCDGKKEFDLPLTVLVNGYSASASEILAGAIKDYGLGELIGTTTYGKGVVQRVLPLSDGTALKLTVSSYFTPNGNNINEVGIEPDEVCEFDSEKYYENGYDNQLEYAKEKMTSKIKENG